MSARYFLLCKPEKGLKQSRRPLIIWTVPEVSLHLMPKEDPITMNLVNPKANYRYRLN